MATIGILPLGRPTFDVAYAETMLGLALNDLDLAGHRIVGPRTLLFDAAAAEAAFAGFAGETLDLVLILQVTFTDASMTASIGQRAGAPLALWAFPEPRVGGRLRLNAFCGLNLASHALGLRGIAFSWLYRRPGAPRFAEAIEDLASGRRRTRARPALMAGSATPEAAAVVSWLRGRRIGRIGAAPGGFDTCNYDSGQLAALTGVTVAPVDLPVLFDRARAADADAVAAVRERAAADVAGLEAVDQPQLDRSLRLKVALDSLRADEGFDALAIRCWPETFTEYGGAVCAPVAMLGEEQVPCACEADVLGALTQLILRVVTGAPSFLVDLVDIDADDDSAVVWHCGQAPISMADPDALPRATIHTNRKMPLLYEFPLKPGRVTFVRVSQARGTMQMVLSGGEMLKRPMAFTGTSGVVRFDRPAGDVLADVMDSGLEHHVALAYGDHRAALRDVAAALAIPVLEL